MKEKWIQWQTEDGAPMQVNDLTITPRSQALVIRWRHGGFVWNRPTAVVVNRQGVEETLPIVDVTRQAVLALGVIGLVWRLLARRRR